MDNKITEHDLQNQIRLYVSQNNLATLFRANAGTAWTGTHISKRPDGKILITNPRPFIGLPEGFPDLFGLKTITITPDMIGRKVAVFTGVEIKTPTGRIRDKQRHMINFMDDAGGIAGVVRSVDDVKFLLNEKFLK